MWSFLPFFRGLFCLRHNLNIWRVGSFKLISGIELGQPVPTAYYLSTRLSKLPGHETLNFSQKTKMKFCVEIDWILGKRWRGIWKRGGRSGSLSIRDTCRFLAVVWAVRKRASRTFMGEPQILRKYSSIKGEENNISRTRWVPHWANIFLLHTEWALLR